MDLTQAFYDRLTADDVLMAMIGSYQETDSFGLTPCVFTGRFIPVDAPRPYIWTWGQIEDAPDDDKITPGREIIRDIWFVVDKSGDNSQLEAMAERGRSLFHRHQLAVDGSRTIVSSCTGPYIAETDENVEGRIVTVRLRLET